MPGSSTTQGFISRMEYFNHALSLKDVKYRIYSKGPYSTSDTVLGQLGFTDYRIRTPIYKEKDGDDGDGGQYTQHNPK